LRRPRRFNFFGPLYYLINLYFDLSDPYAGLPPVYIEDSGASGPNLSVSTLLYAAEDVKIADVVAVIGRIKNADSLADWNNLPSTRQPGVSSTPPTWLPRNAFKVNIRKAKWGGWPTDASGAPVGGEDLKQAEEKRIKKNGADISDAALDAVFDTWAWGASIATPDKVQSTLSGYRQGDTFDLGSFERAAIGGRAVTGLAILFFIVIQVVAFGTLFIGPALREFASIDIGFGKLGACDGGSCAITLWPF